MKSQPYGKLRTGRKSKRETLLGNNAADRFYASMAGVAPQFQSEIAPKREYVKRDESNADDLEAAVLSEVALMLADHPLVLIAVRQNNGAAMNVSGAPVWFYRWMRRPAPKEPMLLPDVWGLLTDGTFWAIECKKRIWLFNPNDDREVKQKRFLSLVASNGGRSGFATSAGAARKIIDG